ncbi:MAG: protein-L-isoaspartate O-methyltransferase [Rhodocyclales bacterium RIFCSPLOWO2_02_FULL_63_24]|nr:MAG: protein-L-isoaspartate O-methyltransferase [Rhodocyclales bacterium RIFCSPLOWO2_02_FULL_63_24]
MSNESDRDLDFLLDEIREEAWVTRYLTSRPTLAPRVLDAMRQVPRHAFVPDELRHAAYANHPLPIGCGQTISQPYIVALMTDLIEPRPEHVVLEIGTGSGYQAAILSRLVKQVYSMEIVPQLAADARARLQRLGYDNIEVRAGNGRLGWPEHAPYDAILVAAAPGRIPPALIEQLKPGGTLVIPVGIQQVGQDLLAIKKQAGGAIEQRRVLPVAFVPLTGPHAN